MDAARHTHTSHHSHALNKHIHTHMHTRVTEGKKKHAIKQSVQAMLYQREGGSNMPAAVYKKKPSH